MWCNDILIFGKIAVPLPRESMKIILLIHDKSVFLRELKNNYYDKRKKEGTDTKFKVGIRAAEI
jgi:hypothetical protein